MPLDLGRRLLAAGTVHPGELRRATHEALTSGKSFVRALADCSMAAREALERGVDGQVQRGIAASPDLARSLPAGLLARLCAVPLRRDPRTGAVDIACVDPRDAHTASELAFHLRSPVRLIAAPLSEIERALLLVESSRPRSTTADYAAAPDPPSVARAPDPPPESRAVVEAIARPDEDAVPLVRRGRSSREPPASVAPPPAARDSEAPMPLSRTRVTLAPPSTSPFEGRADSAPPVQMVVDFRAASRSERTESRDAPSRVKLEPKRPPFASLTPVLESIDAAGDRAELIDAVLRGLGTTSAGAALFAPRRGRFTGMGAVGIVDAAVVRAASLTSVGAIADAITKNERIGTLDRNVDAALYAALGLERYTTVHVLIHPSFVADRAALLLVAIGMGDVLESSRRARVLATAASAALERLLRR